MRSPLLRTAALMALMAWSSVTLAQAPARVGRVSLVQGPVTIDSDDSEGPSDALVNWPVTSENLITTERNARTEIRIGSTAVRLDGDSSLEVVELDDNTLHLQLHRGSANIRIRNPEVLDGFSLETPQGRVRMRDVGSFRVDTGRNQDITVVDVFEGTALVDGGGSSLSVRAGRRVEIDRGDLLTALAVRTGFDDWSRMRDMQDNRVVSDRYVTREMTGYEELDRYGSWSDNTEYGPLWLPRALPTGWAPYRDGRWTWVAPWGWTWVDNAPWGYAPSHYGRWVMVNRRWCWAPGRNVGRPVWAPALVGWVGGNGWSLAFNGGSRRHAPAQGWYPLSPRESFTPGYRVSTDHLRHINRHAGQGRGRNDGDMQRRYGLTVVPHEHFNRRAPVVVPRVPHAVVTPLALQTAPSIAPPALPHRQRDRDDNRDRFRQRADRQLPEGISYRGRRGEQVTVAVPQAAPAPAVVQAPGVAPQPVPRRELRGQQQDDRRETRAERQDDRRDVRTERQDDRRDVRIDRQDDRRDARIERQEDRREARGEQQDGQRAWREQRDNERRERQQQQMQQQQVQQQQIQQQQLRQQQMQQLQQQQVQQQQAAAQQAAALQAQQQQMQQMQQAQQAAAQQAAARQAAAERDARREARGQRDENRGQRDDDRRGRQFQQQQAAPQQAPAPQLQQQPQAAAQPAPVAQEGRRAREEQKEQRRGNKTQVNLD